MRFAFIIKNADQRVLPLSSGLFHTQYGRDFDRLQSSVLDGVPLSLSFIRLQTANGTTRSHPRARVGVPAIGSPSVNPRP